MFRIIGVIIISLLILTNINNLTIIKNKDNKINELKKVNINIRDKLNKLITTNKRLNQKLNKDIRKLQKKRILTDEDIKNLERITEAEAANQQLRGKLLVASVVLNRWLTAKDKTVDDIVKAPRQFDPVDNGKYFTIKPSEETKQAVVMAIERDYSEGSRFFMNPEISSRGNVTWFRKALKLKIKHKDHEFFAPK